MHEGLSFAALPVCVQSHGAGGEIRTPNLLGLSQPPLPFWPHPHILIFQRALLYRAAMPRNWAKQNPLDLSGSVCCGSSLDYG